ncbi:MAG: YeeE/YedE family protein [Sulfurovum sp.]|nr:MAG: Uncharacterised protein [Arcobacter lacus]
MFEELEIYQYVNILGFILGIAFGVIAQKQQFCFSGSIKDYILTKSTRRGASVIMAMIVAVLATTLMTNQFDISLTDTNYHKSDINFVAIIIGGLMFGAGMMIADGCSNRSLIKFGQGDSKALITLLFIGIFAYGTTKGFLSGALAPFVNNPTLIKLSSYIGNFEMNVFVVLAILFVILLILTKSIKRIFTLVDGILVGLLVAVAWYITTVIGSESMERIINPAGITFVYPTAQSLELFMFYQVSEFSFAISVITGALIGAFSMSKVNKRYSFGCTSGQNIDRVKYNMIGGALMGVGGILSIGCTVGQGLTGLSTLAFASAIAIFSIFIGGLITAKFLNKRELLPMCFLFEWDDTPPDYQI